MLGNLSMATQLVNGRAEIYNQVCVVTKHMLIVWETYVLFEINQMGRAHLPIHPLILWDTIWAGPSLLSFLLFSYF